MPKPPLPSQIAGSIAAVRERFVNATDATILSTNVGEFRISNLPLLREIDGIMHQAIRVRIPAGDSDSPLEIRLLQAGTPLATVNATKDVEPGSHLLLVPEVTEAITFTVEIRSTDHILGSVEHVVTPQRKFSIHLVHHSHYDIGYTDPQSKVLEAQLGFLDYALELATLTDDWPDAAKFRWNIEVNWPLKHWFRTRPKHARDAMLRRIQEGRIEVHALPFSMHTEAYSLDELAQQLAYAQELRETMGIEIISAMQTDVPGITVGLASLLTDANIKYLAVAHNYAGLSVPYLTDGQDLKRPFWWEAPDGERLLVWYTDTLIGDAYMEAMQIGFGSGYEDVLGSLPEYLNAVTQFGYPHGQNGNWMNLSLENVEITKQPYEYDILHLRVQGAFADNASSSTVPATIIREWNETWSWPKLRSSLDRDFFAEAEESIGDRLETYRGDWTDWWAIGIGSAAFAMGRNRQSQSDIRTAQTLHALADVVTDEPMSSVHGDVQAAYEEMALFDEHTWGAANPWDRAAAMASSGAYQWTRKEAFAYSAEERTQLLLNGAIQRIAPLAAISPQANVVDSLVIFNPSSWVRTDLVRVFLPRHAPIVSAVGIVDAETEETIPATFAEPVNRNHRPLGLWVTFLARDVPAIGYRRYLVVSTAHDQATTTTQSGDVNAISNNVLNVTVDMATASIASIREAASDRELVESDAPFGFNSWIYDRYTTAPGFNHLSSRLGNAAGPWLLGSRKTGEYGVIASRESNAVWDRLTMRFAMDGTDWAETTLTLPHGAPRLHIRNRLHKPVTMQKESLYIAFPFAGDANRINLEITGGIASPDSPHVPGSAHYYRAMRHWATIEREGASPIAWATNEAALVQLGNIHIPYAPFPKSIPNWAEHRGSIYSWALNNIWDTNFPPAQGGELTFSYAVGVGNDNPIALARDTAASVATPLVGICAPVGVAASASPNVGSFVTIGHPAIEISHLAPSRDGSGITVFLYSLAMESVTTKLSFESLPISSVATGSFLETGWADAKISNGSVDVRVDPGELKAVLLRQRTS